MYTLKAASNKIPPSQRKNVLTAVFIQNLKYFKRRFENMLMQKYYSRHCFNVLHNI